MGAVLLRRVSKGFEEESPGPFKNYKLASSEQSVIAWEKKGLLLHTRAFLLKEGAELEAQLPGKAWLETI